MVDDHIGCATGHGDDHHASFVVELKEFARHAGIQGRAQESVGGDGLAGGQAHDRLGKLVRDATENQGAGSGRFGGGSQDGVEVLDVAQDAVVCLFHELHEPLYGHVFGMYMGDAAQVRQGPPVEVVVTTFERTIDQDVSFGHVVFERFNLFGGWFERPRGFAQRVVLVHQLLRCTQLYAQHLRQHREPFVSPFASLFVFVFVIIVVHVPFTWTVCLFVVVFEWHRVVFYKHVWKYMRNEGIVIVFDMRKWHCHENVDHLFRVSGSGEPTLWASGGRPRVLIAPYTWRRPHVAS